MGHTRDAVTWLMYISSFMHTTPVVSIGFRDTDDTVMEGALPPDKYPKIRLARDKEIVQPLQVQVIPLTASQFFSLNISLPVGTSLPNPAQCK